MGVRSSSTSREGLKKYKKRFKKELNNGTLYIYKMTSDEFFAINKGKFDLIFIDGLHLCNQAFRDIINPLNSLKNRGIIVIHDCNPSTRNAVSRKQSNGIWNGDVWKAFYAFRTYFKDIESFCLDKDFGLGIIGKINLYQIRLMPIDNFIRLDYSFLDNHRKEILNLKNSSYFYKFFRQSQI